MPHTFAQLKDYVGGPIPLPNAKPTLFGIPEPQHVVAASLQCRVEQKPRAASLNAVDDNTKKNIIQARRTIEKWTLSSSKDLIY